MIYFLFVVFPRSQFSPFVQLFFVHLPVTLPFQDLTLGPLLFLFSFSTSPSFFAPCTPVFFPAHSSTTFFFFLSGEGTTTLASER